MHQNWIINKSDRILITGANGFIGLKVSKILLEYGYTRLRFFHRSQKNIPELQQISSSTQADVEFFHGSLLSREDCLRASEGVSVIYHLAAGVGKSYADCFLNSVVTTRNLLDAAISNHTLKRFVNTSSIAVYSNEKIKPGGLFDETCPLDDKLADRHEPYTYGKAKQDELVLEYAQRHNMPYVIVRPSVVFGPGKLKITDRIGTDTFGVFLHLGLNNRIPFTYVDNCAEAIVLAGLKKGINGEVFNVFDDDLPTSREFLKLYKQKVRRLFSIPIPHWVWLSFCTLWEKYSKWSEGQLPPVFNRRACSVYWKDHVYSNKKAKELLGWQPRISMNEALERFFGYMRKKENRK